MRLIIFLVLAVLCMNFTDSPAQVLNKIVSVQYKNMTIENVLKDISKKHKVNFSYSSSVIPVNKKVTLSVTNKTLSYVLDQVFKDVDVAYQEVGTQIVLKASPKKSSQNVTEEKIPEKEKTLNIAPDTLGNLEVSSNTDELKLETLPLREDTIQFFPEPDLVKNSYEDTITKESLKRQYKNEKRKLRDQYYRKQDSLDRKDPASKGDLRNQFRKTMLKLEQQLNTISDSLKLKEFLKSDTNAVKRDAYTPDSNGYYYTPAQATFVNPIGTNGELSSKTVNTFSFNVAGTSAGLEGFEVGVILNNEKDYVLGYQLAGVGNYVKNEMSGMQMSGLYNVSTGRTRGVQLVGLLNYADHHMKGGQVAGFLNVADTITGAQVSGFLNTSRNLKGVQIGFMNIADTVSSGFQLGFINFGGYERIEMWGSESLSGNLAFKTGSRNLYNIFALGARPEGSDFTWGFGYGLGAEIKLHRVARLSLDALAYSVHHNGISFDEVNLLNQFRTTFGIMLGERVCIFAGPVFNVMISQHYNSETGTYGSPLTPKWNLYNKTDHNDNNISMWIGGNFGIRF